ncbi:MAG: hmp-p kinase: hydroxymethylpyrimidine kinase/phosphomethylpyrimidine kinase [Verrucomicrobiales bacterium]|nr:hmp-p kinase: hydroxymethylpyrimidine kinase/phosphomethylpyrimidine kinase [Verrucomicrobiales bacterium]
MRRGSMSRPFSSVPVVLSIAGSDSCAGAGIQADLKTFTALGVHGLTAVTCVVSEIPGKVSRIHAVPSEIIADQIRILLGAYPVAVVKTGMLFNAEIIRLTADALRTLPPERRPLLVVDPVMIASSGDPLITSDAIAAYEELLFPMATLITPNLDEAGALLGRSLTAEADLFPAAAELHEKFGAAILLKGGHLQGAKAVDFLHGPEGVHTFSSPFIHNVETHGTGCTYSSAIAAGLAKNPDLPAACGMAKRYITLAIKESLAWGEGADRVMALRQWVQT